MADVTVSPDIDTLLQSTSNEEARSNLGISSTAPLYILAQGQSNINPRGTATETSINSNVKVWNNNGNNAWETWDLLASTAQTLNGEVNGASWAFYFAKRLQELTGREIRVIMNTQSGAQVDTWLSPSGSNWLELEDILTNAAIPNNSISVRLWGQGEADASESESSYSGKYNTVLSQIDARPEMVASFPTLVMPLAETTGTQDQINVFFYSDAIKGDRTGRNYLMDGAQFLETEVDGYHYTAESAVIMGRQFAWAAYNASNVIPSKFDSLKLLTRSSFSADLANLTKLGDVDGSATYDRGVVTISSSATANTATRFAPNFHKSPMYSSYENTNSRIDLTKEGAISFIHRHGTGTTNGTYYISFTSKFADSTTVGNVAADYLFGVKVANNTLTATLCDGTTLNENVGNSVALSVSTNAKVDRYKIIWDGSGLVEYYKNDFVFARSTSAPATDSVKTMALSLDVDNGIDAAAQSFLITDLQVW